MFLQYIVHGHSVPPAVERWTVTAEGSTDLTMSPTRLGSLPLWGWGVCSTIPLCPHRDCHWTCLRPHIFNNTWPIITQLPLHVQPPPHPIPGSPTGKQGRHRKQSFPLHSVPTLQVWTGPQHDYLCSLNKRPELRPQPIIKAEWLR